MKLIDKKGKIFGLINIIDLATVLVLGLLIFGGVKRLKSQPLLVDEVTEAFIIYQVEDVRMATVENIVKGDPLYHYDKGGYIGEIEEVEYKPYTEPLESNGEWISSPIPEKYVVNIKVKSDVKNNPDVILVGGEQTRVGTQYRMKNKRIAFFGTAMDIEVSQ